MLYGYGNKTVAMNKTILQDNNTLPSYPNAIFNPYGKNSIYSPVAPVFTPNGVLTTTPYKTIQKDYGMDYTRLKEPINTIATGIISSNKRNRYPIPIYDTPDKNYVISDKNDEITEINPEETIFTTKSDKNMLLTPDAIEMKYKIDPSKELSSRKRQPFKYIKQEYNNMLPGFLRNREQNNNNNINQQTNNNTQQNNKNKEQFNPVASRNQLYKQMWNYNIKDDNNMLNKFDKFYEGFDNEIISTDNQQNEKKLTDKYEYYYTKTDYIQDNDLLEDINDDNNNITRNETFVGATNYTTSTDNYLSVLLSQATSILCFVKRNKDFAPWMKYWDYLDKNIHKQGGQILFEQLDASDADVAYVQNKGEQMKFRIRDSSRFVPISIYTYVLIHEMAHLANGEEWGHGPNFQMLMHLMELAGYEIGILKVEKYPANPYYSGSTPILTKDSIKSELYDAIDVIISNNGNKKFYTDLKNKIANT